MGGHGGLWGIMGLWGALGTLGGMGIMWTLGVMGAWSEGSSVERLFFIIYFLYARLGGCDVWVGVVTSYS